MLSIAFLFPSIKHLKCDGQARRLYDRQFRPVLVFAIAAHFPNADPMLIKLVLIVPSLMIIPFSFISSSLTKKISKRSIVFLELGIYIVGGVGAQFANTIEVLLAFRLVLGAGVGLVMPLSFTLISDHFYGVQIWHNTWNRVS